MLPSAWRLLWTLQAVSRHGTLPQPRRALSPFQALAVPGRAPVFPVASSRTSSRSGRSTGGPRTPQEQLHSLGFPKTHPSACPFPNITALPNPTPVTGTKPGGSSPSLCAPRLFTGDSTEPEAQATSPGHQGRDTPALQSCRTPLGSPPLLPLGTEPAPAQPCHSIA